MPTLRNLSIVLICCEIFLLRFVHLEHVEFYKRHSVIQAGENTFACSGRSVEFRWKYNYPDHLKTVWSKQKNTELIDVASWSNEDFNLESRAGEVGFSSGRLSSNGCCGLVINSVTNKDEGLYAINITSNYTEENSTRTGYTTLYVYEDCPDISTPQLSISCVANSTDKSAAVKTTDFTYRDIVDLSLKIPKDPLVIRRFYYQEQQHKIVQQPIRSKCYYGCSSIQWTMSKKSLSLAFFSKDPYLNMTVFARLYHKKALLAVFSLAIRVVDPLSETGKKIPKCKNREPLPRGGGNSLTWSGVLLASITLAVSNFNHQITLLS